MKSESLTERTMDVPIPLKKLIRLSFINWYWFLMSALGIFCYTFIYLRYTTPTFKIRASVLVRDDTKGSDFGDAIGVQGLDLPIGKSNVDNEVEVLKSRSLAESVVGQLQLYVTYFSTGDVKTSEIFDQRPVILHFINLNRNIHKKESETYEVRPAGRNRVVLTHSGHSWNGQFGDTFALPHGQAVILRTQSPFIEENKYTMRVEPLRLAIRNYQKALTVNPANKMVSMISLTWTDRLPEKGETILNEHLNTYLRNSIENKTRIADSTISFIDQNLKEVAAEMYDIEQKQTRYRKDHHLADLPESARALIQNRVRLVQELTDNHTEQKILYALRDHIQHHPTAMIPMEIIAADGPLTALINQYNESLSQRAAALKDRTEDHPSVVRMDAQIPMLSAAIGDGISQYEKKLTARESALKMQNSTLLKQVDQIPLRQEALTDYFRKLQISEERYAFLTRKRLETSLSKSSVQGAGRIVDAARADSAPAYPNRSLTLLIACLASLGIPAAVIYMRTLYDERIWDKTEFKNLTTAPVVASIGRLHLTKGTPNALQNNLSENFRMLRTHLLRSPEMKKVIMITSGIQGEGKTFVAIHLSETFASAQKKTLLMEFNLRCPRIAAHYGLPNKGIADYLISEISLDELTRQPHPGSSFDVLPAGHVSENPADLLLNPRLEILIRAVSERYDFIILDTPPSLLVADAEILSPFADTTLMVVRKRLTKQSFLLTVQNWVIQRNMPDIRLILNDCEKV